MSRAKLLPTLFIVSVAFTVTVMFSVAALGAAEDRPNFGSWAPGISSPVSAMAQGPDVTTSQGPSVSPSIDLERSVRFMARGTRGDETRALQTLRVLRRQSGPSAPALYGFSPDTGGAVCLAVLGRSVACPTAPTNDLLGVLWILNGGYPSAVNGATVNIPSSLTGIAADDVRTVVLTENGRRIPLSIARNTFVYELNDPAADSAWVMTLTVTYRDGHTATAAIPDPRPEA